MNEIKLNLSIVLPGRTLLSKEECLKTTQKVITTKNGKKRVVTKVVEDWDKTDMHTMRVEGVRGSEPEVISFRTRKCRPATQSLNMTKEAYEYMIDRESCPSWSTPSKWKAMSKKERLESHLRRTTEHLGGISFTYQVFED